MVRKMNKGKFLEELKVKTGLDESKCIIISDIIDEVFIIGKNNKEKMLDMFMDKLSIDREEADNIYNTSMGIIINGVKDKIIHPFKKDE